jgi:CPA1 family monovalent cation:H+ antiporter
MFLALAAIPAVLAARVAGVAVPISLMPKRFGHGAVMVFAWAGLRDGISIALALSLPSSPYRELILVHTYTVVVFSVLAQGLTLQRLLARMKDRVLPR